MKKPARKPARRVAKAPRVANVRRGSKRARAAAKPAVLTLPAHFDIRSVADVARVLRRRVNGPGPLAIDAAGVTTTDTAGLQLLLAARRAAQARSVALEWRGVSDALRAASATIGLSEALGLP